MSAGGGLAMQVGTHFTIEADLRAVFLLPPPAVALAGSTAGRAGLPVLVGSIGLRPAL